MGLGDREGFLEVGPRFVKPLVRLAQHAQVEERSGHEIWEIQLPAESDGLREVVPRLSTGDGESAKEKDQVLQDNAGRRLLFTEGHL